MTVVEKIKIVERILNEDINPKLKADGGFLELVDIEGNKIKVKFLGACSTCPSAGLTFKDVVQKDLKNKINGEIEVVLV
ncbi:MAG TPA: NifU family protein [Elusimicrobiales bacterium]|nr:NifU family protein [Elusimicrobiales bacterium]